MLCLVAALALAAQEQDLQALDAELHRLLRIYTDRHPDVVALRRRIEALKSGAAPAPDRLPAAPDGRVPQTALPPAAGPQAQSPNPLSPTIPPVLARPGKALPGSKAQGGFQLPTDSPEPVGRARRGGVLQVRSGDLVFAQGVSRFGDYRVAVDGAPMASGWPAERIGYLADGRAVWLPIGGARPHRVESASGLAVEAQVRDPQGGVWTLRRSATPGAVPGTLDLRLEIACSEDREAIHLPWLTLLAGIGTFGTHKHQGLFPGIEYLADEPSSSEADLAPPWNDRLVPDGFKITIPLMAIGQGRRFIAVAWQPSPAIAAVFDSPDRVFRTESHLMALSAPAVGPLRAENALVAHSPLALKAGEPLVVPVQLLGGKAAAVDGAVRLWASGRPWPDPPGTPGGLQQAIGLMASGWLDSEIHRDGTWAYVTGGELKPSAEALLDMAWLARFAEDPRLRERLSAGIRRGLQRLPGNGAPVARIGQIATPFLPATAANPSSALAAIAKEGSRLADDFGLDGRIEYRVAPGKPDYGRTHYARHANGYSAERLAKLLGAAALTGEPGLKARALRILDQQDRLYRDTVPRGAQTWEVPLHTPDILASAYLTEAFLLGYELTGKERYRQAARDWAWTGVAFVYLIPPPPGPIGLYATIPVLGGTDWSRIDWIGRPVQWCGLVYADSLLRLSRYDDSAPWAKIARGIVATGLEITWPAGSGARTGLLADALGLATQSRTAVSFSPSRVQQNLGVLLGAPRLSDRRAVPALGWIVHAWGDIGEPRADREGGSLELEVRPWPQDPSWILIEGPEPRKALVRICPPAVAADDHPRCREIRPAPLPTGLHVVALKLDGPARISVKLRGGALSQDAAKPVP